MHCDADCDACTAARVGCAQGSRCTAGMGPAGSRPGRQAHADPTPAPAYAAGVQCLCLSAADRDKGVLMLPYCVTERCPACIFVHSTQKGMIFGVLKEVQQTIPHKHECLQSETKAVPEHVAGKDGKEQVEKPAGKGRKARQGAKKWAERAAQAASIPGAAPLRPDSSANAMVSGSSASHACTAL